MPSGYRVEQDSGSQPVTPEPSSKVLRWLLSAGTSSLHLCDLVCRLVIILLPQEDCGMQEEEAMNV